MVDVDINAIADRAVRMREGDVTSVPGAAIPDRQWDLPGGPIIMRIVAYRPRTTSGPWKASLRIQSPCLRGTSANPAAVQASNELATFILKRSK
jgi:hypothetical protein